jgi:hypothetical protein
VLHHRHDVHESVCCSPRSKPNARFVSAEWGDLFHACQSTEALSRWCECQPQVVAHNGLCLVHRAEIMQVRGAWEQPLEESRRAAERFTRGVLNEIACGKAHYRHGEVRRLRGEPRCR